MLLLQVIRPHVALLPENKLRNIYFYIMKYISLATAGVWRATARERICNQSRARKALDENIGVGLLYLH